MSTEVDETMKPANLSGWKKNRDHTVMAPSGTIITIRIPDLPQMIATGKIPQHLLDAAVGVASGEAKPSVDLIREQFEFTEALTMMSVVAPKITDEDLPDIPYEDKDFIVSVATRQRDLDALGDHIAGLTKFSKFRSFRGLDGIDSDVDGL